MVLFLTTVFPYSCFWGVSGIDANDNNTKFALLDFGFYLAVGAVDEAVKSIQVIHNPKVIHSGSYNCLTRFPCIHVLLTVTATIPFII